jgi:hypothetical protein
MAPQSLLEPGISGGIGGMIGAIGTFFGISWRISRLEKDIEGKVGKEKCDTCAQDTRAWMERIDKKLDKLLGE